MKWGISSYSPFRSLTSGQMTILDVVEWINGVGREHVEIVPLGFQLDDNPERR
ncbi:hypothetical protein [Paenibacillus alginolyticus]|uniref:Uncharacterized protein n=1 Tax=Paenibacillus alginolyticus TaxID=59839 RepID=A0ABT4GP20_9BACL|nr:hypothetical protein [Paenibacillus alginolyticus]MCY9697966.1 hypothetical protein [Paenibacillus alginolyticus]MEC0148223.1 hypothetical protein [Paenibacillus alginolyticus]